jgi:hypothetical protein
MASAPSLKTVLLASGLAALAVTALLLRGGRPHGTPGTEIEAPPGWELAGKYFEDYSVRLDPQGGRAGGSAVRIASVVPQPRGYAGVARLVDPGPFRGRRVTLQAFTRAEAIAGDAALWLRIDTPEQFSWALDNMQERPIRGTRSWQPYRIVLDVSRDASAIYYGALLSGVGTVWLDGFELREAKPDEPSTEPGWSKLRRRGLDFEEIR